VQLTRHDEPEGPRWALDGRLLEATTSLEGLLALPRSDLMKRLGDEATGRTADGPFLPPVADRHEVWAAGVTYLRSRDARQSEAADGGDVYDRVYHAERPELFFKAIGWRVVGHGQPIRIRRDAHWNVPEPELTLVLNAGGEIVGCCAGNDVSSRDIEGANPLYLPQAKVYTGSCALGPGILLAGAAELANTAISVDVVRGGQSVFSGQIETAQMKRSLDELAAFLFRELEFPSGVFLMTGTGIVPPIDFSLEAGDVVRIAVANLELENMVASD
jgi:2-dehydro-3-deoxy-D-arabinonate dehydratase